MRCQHLSLFADHNLRMTKHLTVEEIPFFMLFNDLTSEFKGLIDLEAEEIAKYGPGEYIPPVAISYWSSRTMIGIGLLMVLLALLAVWWSRNDKFLDLKWFLKILIPAGVLPTIAITAGWIIAETGRWPWIVHGLQKIEDAVSPTITPGNIIFSLVSFLVLYSVLGFIGVKLLLKYGTNDPDLAEGKGE